LPDTNSKHALLVAEVIRKNMEAVVIPLITDGTPTRITVSIGICSGVPQHDTTADIYMNNADAALYLAKEGGRNQAVLYDWESNT
jgi:diguanylate cyclase (GGDEF)-like protein